MATKQYIKRVLLEVLKDYMSKTSMHGYRYLTESGRHWVERLLWMVVQAVATWGILYTILDIYSVYINTPTVTTVSSVLHPIWNVPFPAVAVCNINKVVESRAREFAKQIQKATQTNKSDEEILDLVRHLGRMYDHEVEGHDQVTRLHHLLATLHGDSYDLSKILTDLSPSCSEMLVKCKWRGKIVDCGQLFKPTKTKEGICCGFNTVRNYDLPDEWLKAELNTSELILAAPGARMGLSVVVNPMPDSYFYPIISSYGIKVLVFSRHDFPDTPNGGLVEKLVPFNTEVFFRMGATASFATEAVRFFDPKQRKCFFKKELPKKFPGFYSPSECLMKCRIESMLTLCNCLPFYYPIPGNVRTCNLRDVLCLFKNKDKWQNIRPDPDIPGMEYEKTQSLECRECHPSCTDTTYQVQTSTANILLPTHASKQLLTDINLTADLSVFHLFYGSVDTTRLKKDVLYQWYDLLSSFGGICGFFVGFSFISVVEFVYFFTMRGFFFFKHETIHRSRLFVLSPDHPYNRRRGHDVEYRYKVNQIQDTWNS